MSRNIYKIALIGLATLFIAGCHIYQSIGKSPGAFLHPVNGPDFVGLPDDQWDSKRHALIYFYRPHSQWSAEEIEAPSVYIDDKHYFNLRNDAYTWLEVYPGERVIDMRRPLLGLEGVASPLLTIDLDRIAKTSMTVEAGKIYYLRYEEEFPPETLHPDIPPDHPLNTGDLRLVGREIAMAEMPATQFLKPDLLAPNHAATSIARVNIDGDYKRRKAELLLERKEEIAKLKEQGYYRPAPWYWPFGGGPTKKVKADKKLQELEKSYQNAVAESDAKAQAVALASAREAEKGGKSWWKVW